MQNPTTIKKEGVATTGHALAHHEHIYGRRKPSYWWIFFGKEKVRLPVNIYVVEDESGLVLFDAGPPVLIVGDLAYNDEFLEHDRPPDTGERVGV